jgi:uncharacterized membrane protein YfbV (UPF0208 family)
MGTHKVQSPKHAMPTGVIFMCAIFIMLVSLKGLLQLQKYSITCAASATDQLWWREVASELHCHALEQKTNVSK